MTEDEARVKLYRSVKIVTNLGMLFRLAKAEADTKRKGTKKKNIEKQKKLTNHTKRCV